MDDESTIRSMSVAMLGHLGYEVPVGGVDTGKPDLAAFRPESIEPKPRPVPQKSAPAKT